MPETMSGDYPFRAVLSLKPLLAYLEKTAQANPQMEHCPIDGILSRARQIPALNEPIHDPRILDKHQDVVSRLMALVFPPLFWEREAVGAMVPFSVEPFYVSPSFRRLFLGEDGSLMGRLNVKEESFNLGRVIRAYMFILEQVYGVQQEFDYHLIRTVQDPESGLERHFKIVIDFRFVEVQPTRSPKKLSDQERELIREHLMEPQVLKRILPPEDFELHGFTILHAVDVTESEVLSALERDLIDQESIATQLGFQRLQQRLRTLFRRPSLVAGLSAIQGDQILLLNSGCELTRSCIFADSHHVPVSEHQGTVFERAIQSRKVVRIPDILKDPGRKRTEEEVRRMGIRSLLIAPLFYQGTCIGTLDIGSPEPGEFGPMDIFRMEALQPLFTVAVKRALDDLNNRIQRVIKEKCTAIHPTVEWRFNKAALHYLEELRKGNRAEMEPIVFRNVYPLYGASDIRGSTDERNRAIRRDLMDQLDLALAVVVAAEQSRSMLILKELAKRIQDHRDRIQDGLSTGHEMTVSQFLQREVESFFPYLGTFGPGVRKAIEAYQAAIDPAVGKVYRLRKEFEESVRTLNEKMLSYLDAEEAKAQAMLPHYFERHQTDGLDYIVYLGASLLEDGRFNELDLRNMRLWQLRMTCGLAALAEGLKPHLKIPLQTAHLILVQNSPLSIRFRFDEKRFDVDGTYDIRHEVIKSRLDKAMINGGRERLTQPGQIAIVYSQPEEAREMRRHIDFLQSEGLLEKDVEHLELDDLPGVRGLKALRASVIPQTSDGGLPHEATQGAS